MEIFLSDLYPNDPGPSGATGPQGATGPTPANVVFTTGNQTISGDKTFTNNLLFNNNENIYGGTRISGNQSDINIRTFQSYTDLTFKNDFIGGYIQDIISFRNENNTGRFGPSINYDVQTSFPLDSIIFYQTGQGYSNIFSKGPYLRLGYHNIISEVPESRLGVGTLFPQEKLHISGGNLRVEGDVYGNNLVYNTGNQTINGLKDFTARPTVNTIPIALSGEAASNIEQLVKNDSNTTLYKGQPVYVSGSNGNNILIHPASNSGEGTSSKTFGLLKQTLLNNEQGYVVTEGALLNIDTSMATEGDPVWLGPTGNLIYGLANKPKAPQHLVSLGFVERSHQNQGKIFVKVQNGFELEELHNVRIVNEQNSDIIIYNSGSGLWLNSGINFGNFYTNNNPSGYITSIINTTYSQLTGSKAQNKLISGQHYRISDFHLKWWNQSINDTTVKSGLFPEPLIVFALSSSGISHEAKSEPYPQDTVYYDIDASGSYSWGSINNNVAIPDFKGWIYRRIDHKLNIDIGWDWRHITSNCCRPIITGTSIYSPTTNYNRLDVVRSNLNIYKFYYSLKNFNSGISILNEDFWLPINDTTISEGLTYFPTDETFGFRAYKNNQNNLLLDLPADTGTRIQQPTFVSVINSQSSLNMTGIANVTIKGGHNNVIRTTSFFPFSNNNFGYGFDFNFIIGAVSNNVGNNFQYNTIYSIANNKIGNNFTKNVCISLSSNDIGNQFTDNTVYDLYNNYIIGSFGRNVIGKFFENNSIGINFIVNFIGNGFNFNQIGNYFYNNIVGNNMIYNIFGVEFQGNTIGNNFRSNRIESSCTIGNVTGATHIYNNYNTNVFKNSNGTVRLSYFNGSDQLIVTDPTA